MRSHRGAGSWAAVYLAGEDRCGDSLLPNPWKAQLPAFLLGQETRPWPGCIPGTVATAAPINPGLFPAGAEKGPQLPQEAGLRSAASLSKVLDWGRLSPGGQSRNICGCQDRGCPWHPVHGDQGAALLPAVPWMPHPLSPWRMTRPQYPQPRGGDPGLIIWQKIESDPCSCWTQNKLLPVRRYKPG